MGESQDKVLKECYKCKRILFVDADKYTEGEYVCDRCNGPVDSTSSPIVEGVDVKPAE